jgi:glucosamine--fructose-6-phosphate aminotransferase (isomerizing)
MTNIEREIHEQPDAAVRLIDAEREPVARIAAAIRDYDPAYVCIAARGTSDNAARYAQYIMGAHLGLTVALAAPSLHTLYRKRPRFARALVIGISQSGQSEDVRQVITDARHDGALTVTITNAPESPLAQNADHHLYIHAGAEIAVAATKTYTTELVALALLTAAVRADSALLSALDHIVPAMRATLEQTTSIASWSRQYADLSQYAVIGRGYNYCTAYEISLKIKELCSVTGEEYSEADFRHGPIAVVREGFPALIIAPGDAAAPKMRELVEKLNARGADCLVISDDATFEPLSAHFMPIAPLDDWLSPITAVIPGQVLAMQLALARGRDVDAPIGLTKVTNTQ